SPTLRALIIPWAGLPDVTRELALEFPHVAVHNLHHNAAATAEMAMALLLAAAKCIVPIDRLFRQHDWTPRYQRAQSVLLAGKTALVLGYGQIGQRVARACAALGMHVLATRRSQPELELIEGVKVYPPHDLLALLPRSEVLIITLPLTPETRGLIGERELALLPRGSIVVNVGRGSIIDEAALYHALRDRQLASAGLDVWYQYPADEAARSSTPPAHYPFHELDNVVLSPHRAGDAIGNEAARLAALAALLNAATRGEDMPNRVAVSIGY
ncbi:MAG TPA: NAD(P)-dependent oxidoreductase, partial [Anaerolineae bacterium]|nr:NAD(P)-dependent oxidoreductase [Anaerolineae bacterium]